MGKLVDSLKEKAKALLVEKTDLEKRIREDNERLAQILNAIHGIDAILRLEGVTMEQPVAPAPVETPSEEGGPSPLVIALRESLADGKPHTVNELITMVKRRGVDFGTREPYRTVMFTLMGIRRGKQIARIGRDSWQLAKAV